MPLTWWLKTEKRDELAENKTTNQKVIAYCNTGRFFPSQHIVLNASFL
jgi:hypothetical protein